MPLETGNAYLFKLEGTENYLPSFALGSKRNRTVLSDFYPGQKDYGHVIYNRNKKTVHNVHVLEIHELGKPSFDSKTANDLLNESKYDDLVYVKLEVGEYIGFSWGACHEILDESDKPFKTAQEHADYILNIIEACGIIGAFKLGLTDKHELPPEIKKSFEARRPHVEKLVKSVHKEFGDVFEVAPKVIGLKTSSIFFNAISPESKSDDDMEDLFPYCGLDVDKNTLAGIPIVGYKIIDYKALLEPRIEN